MGGDQESDHGFDTVALNATGTGSSPTASQRRGRLSLDSILAETPRSRDASMSSNAESESSKSARSASRFLSISAPISKINSREAPRSGRKQLTLKKKLTLSST